MSLPPQQAQRLRRANRNDRRARQHAKEQAAVNAAWAGSPESRETPRSEGSALGILSAVSLALLLVFCLTLARR